MPIYEYQCSECGHQLELIQKLSEPPLVECPQCGEEALKKLVSAAAFQLKGSGWYVTDFRDKDKKKDQPAKAAGQDAQENTQAKASEGGSDAKSGGESSTTKKTETTDS